MNESMKRNEGNLELVTLYSAVLVTCCFRNRSMVKFGAQFLVGNGRIWRMTSLRLGRGTTKRECLPSTGMDWEGCSERAVCW